MTGIYQVCVLHTHRDSFDYLADGCSPAIGARVWVPFRNQTRLGIVIDNKQNQNHSATLKNIQTVIDDIPILSKTLLTLCSWISTYYQSPLSEVLPLALPKKYRDGLPTQLPMTDYYQLKIPAEAAKNRIPAQARRQRELIDFINAHRSVSRQKLSEYGFSTNLIMALLSADLVTCEQHVRLPVVTDHITTPPLALNAEQELAVTTITEHLHHFHSFLLYGVTGSGKTEVYLQVIAPVLNQGKQVLVMVPEIGLTPQLVSRFKDRFRVPMAIIHSNLNESERHIAWQMAQEKRVQMIIGTRSSVLTPMPDLGLIIIDEEHDMSFKQMEGVRYSARDTALMRAHLANIPIILGSATPSLESLHNGNRNKYTILKLHHKALTNIPLHYQLVDLRQQTVQHGLALSTLNIIKEHLLKKNQVLVFINRRGFAPVLLCHQCGWMADCRACDSHLTFHKQLGQVICHHCGLTQKKPTHCLSCSNKELIPVGAGTQRVHEFLSTQFPDTSIIRIDRDAIRKKNSLDEHLEAIKSGKAQLIIGTQMLAKGHHFPKLSLVVALDTDAALYNHDFRALEHLGQLLMQVSGRAGRAEQAGQALIQTHAPQHPLLNILIQQGYDAFANTLLTSRQQAQLPPFHFVVVIRAQGKMTRTLLEFMHAIKEQIQTHPITVIGPAPAPLPRKANQHRMQLFIKSHSRKLLNHALTQLRAWLTLSKLSNGIRWNVDVDPMDLS